ncbi:hypothetical protein TeGR_g9957 [Tetraparma gracilis]|uniref:Leucine-rich repeat domain-containing protein n=1 Tax=Tetraparma gracilis TaxID=2962635 RepID=A0ABQ6NDJ2_9STRA|nr:hypothetical protein TeGR_g9957 [Tetraparma gracilis]
MIAGDALEDTPLHYPCIAKSSELNDARLRLAYDLDETETIVTFKEDVETIEGVARADKEKVVEVIIPEKAKVLAEKAFEGCKLLAVAGLPHTLEEVGNEAFKDCSSLPPEFAFPASVTKVGNAVLWGTGTALESQERAKVCIVREQYSLDAYGRATFKEGVETIKQVEKEDQTKIKEVIINEGAKVIGEGAFMFCDELTAVSVPSTVVEIGSEAFSRCGKLPSDFIEKLPASVIKMHANAFLDTPLHDQCRAEIIERAPDVEREQYTLVKGKLVFKEGVETIKKVEKEDQTKIKDVIINEGAKVIGEGAFMFCDELTAVSVPSTVVEIGSKAFYWCGKLPSDFIEKLPASITYINESAFEDTPLHDKCVARHMELFRKYGVEREQYTLDGEGKLVVKEGVENVERVMEEDMEQIREVILPEGAKTIADCKELTDIILPEGLLEIGEYAFFECGKLPSDFIEKLPASIIKIAKDAFVYTPLHNKCIDARLRLAYDLDETGTIITFKEDVETIEGVARADKEKVVEVIIPEGAKVLAEKAFEGCKLLTAVTLPQALEEIGDGAFKDCSSLPPDFATPASVTKVGAFAFLGTGTAAESQERAKVCIEREQYSLDAYGRATFKEGVETIKKVEKEDQKKIKDVIINEGAKVIGERAFKICEELTAVSVPSTVVEIGIKAFYVCTKLPSDFIDKLPASVIKIARDAFKDTPLDHMCFVRHIQLEGVIKHEQYTLDDKGKLVFKEGVETIKAVAPVGQWEDREEIKEVIINEGAKVIGKEAFSWCKELTAVSVPSTVVEIGSGAFYKCGKLPSDFIEKLPASITYINESAFEDTPLHDKCVARHIELFRKYGVEREQYTLDGEGKLVVKEGVENVERVMEEDMEQIREVIIPEGAKTIAECEKLPSDFIEKLPASITKIAKDAFKETPLYEQCDDARLRFAYDLDETGTIVTFKEDVETIEGVARADKEKVVEVIIPEKAKVLAEKAFEGCKLLTAVTLPRMLEEVGDEAFKDCSSLPQDFAIPASVIKIGVCAFMDTGTALESQERAKVCIEREQYSLDAYGRATFKKGVETIKKVEEDQKKIKEVIINEGAKVIGGKAFFQCWELTAVSVPSTVVEIGSEAFYRCYKLPSDFIEKLPAIPKIHRNAFKETPLHEQGIARNLKQKKDYSVDDETGTIATFEEGVETIEMQDEEDKKKVVKVIVNDGAITIAEKAFFECKVLAVVSVPATLEAIGEAAFRG